MIFFIGMVIGFVLYIAIYFIVKAIKKKRGTLPDENNLK